MAKINYYKQAIAEGKCGKCREPNPAGGSLCSACREKEKLKQARYREQAQENGLCIGCKRREPEPGRTRCRECLDVSRVDQAGRVAERVDAGLCPCGKTPKEGCVLCQECIDKRSRVSSKHYRRRKEAGTCYYCDKPPMEGHVLCEEHVSQKRDYRRDLKLEALQAYGGLQCVKCGCLDVDILELDHVNNDGAKHRRALGMSEPRHAGTEFYQHLRRNGYPKNPPLRVLCPNCNKKAHHNSRHPAATKVE